MASTSLYFFREPVFDDKAVAKHLTAEALALLGELRAELVALGEWSAPALHALLNAFAGNRSLGLGKVAQPLRVALTGESEGMELDLAVPAIEQGALLSGAGLAPVASARDRVHQLLAALQS